MSPERDVAFLGELFKRFNGVQSVQKVSLFLAMSLEMDVAFLAELFKRFKGFNKFKKSNKPTINTKQ